MTRTANLGLAVVTGASAGIGAVYADRLARRGHDLLLVARNKQKLDAIAARLRLEHGVAVEVMQADLLDRQDLDLVGQRVTSDPDITMVVNNAGVAQEGLLLGTEFGGLDAMIQLNVVAATRVAVAAATAMAARGRGALVNIASVVALAPEMLNGVYSGSKAYVLNLSQALQAEAGKRGVTVQTVLPGATRTEIWERAGIDIAGFPASMIMETEEMVDAALAGLDMGETVTIPSLPDNADWEAFSAARTKMGPNLSRDHAAARYRAKVA